MHALVNLLAWFVARAGANVMPPGANRAGRLVPGPEDAAETETGTSLEAHWALWAAVTLVILILAIGYIRRRWKGGTAVRPARFRWSSAWSRYSARK
jgi:hypothetical protein